MKIRQFGFNLIDLEENLASVSHYTLESFTEVTSDLLHNRHVCTGVNCVGECLNNNYNYTCKQLCLKIAELSC